MFKPSRFPRPSGQQLLLRLPRRHDHHYRDSARGWSWQKTAPSICPSLDVKRSLNSVLSKDGFEELRGLPSSRSAPSPPIHLSVLRTLPDVLCFGLSGPQVIFTCVDDTGQGKFPRGVGRPSAAPGEEEGSLAGIVERMQRTSPGQRQRKAYRRRGDARRRSIVSSQSQRVGELARDSEAQR